MELSRAHLRYLLAIGQLSQGRGAVSSVQVARALRVSRPSVARMLAVLAEKELVTRERYGKIHLTETGAALARELAAGLRDLERRLSGAGAGAGSGGGLLLWRVFWRLLCRSGASGGSAPLAPARQWEAPRRNNYECGVRG